MVAATRRREKSARTHSGSGSLTGTGTIADPVRPLFAPANAKEYQARSGVRQFSWQPTDDGKHAIVEFVTEDRAVLTRILSDPRVLKAFDNGKQKRSDIERELKKHRKDFDVEAFSRGKAR